MCWRSSQASSQAADSTAQASGPTAARVAQGGEPAALLLIDASQLRIALERAPELREQLRHDNRAGRLRRIPLFRSLDDDNVGLQYGAAAAFGLAGLALASAVAVILLQDGGDGGSSPAEGGGAPGGQASPGAAAHDEAPALSLLPVPGGLVLTW